MAYGYKENREKIEAHKSLERKKVIMSTSKATLREARMALRGYPDHAKMIYEVAALLQRQSNTIAELRKQLSEKK